MKAEQVKKLMPVLIAYAEGKTIEFRSNGQWRVSKNLEFCYEPEDYRVKPEPDVRWMAEIRTIEGTEIRRSSGGRLTKEEAEEWGNRLWGSRFIRAVKFVEVLE
jgi:hypothetical protein